MVNATQIGQPLQLHREGKAVYASVKLQTGDFIRFRVWNLEQERTGVHGKLELFMNTSLLDYSGGVNIERAEERTRLCNSAYKQLTETMQGFYSLEQMKRDLAIFTSNAWEVWLENESPLQVVGSLTREPIRFWLEPFITHGGGTILFGPPGRGKSYIALLMAVCIQNGLQTLWNTEQAPVLFVNLERDDQSVAHRIGAVNNALSQLEEPDSEFDPVDSALWVLSGKGKRLYDVSKNIEKHVREHGTQVVVLDSLSRAGMGDMNENLAVNRAMDAMNGLAPSWIGLGHTPRHDESHVYGGIHYDAAADIMVQQMAEQQETKLGVVLKITKANDIGKQQVNRIGLEFDNAGLVRLWTPDATEFPQLAVDSAYGKQPAEKVMDYLKEHGEATTTEISNDTGIAMPNVSSILHTDMFTFTRKDGRNTYYKINEKVDTSFSYGK